MTNPQFSKPPNRRDTGTAFAVPVSLRKWPHVDAAGEVTSNGQHRYSYNGDGLIASVDDGAIRYSYNAEGNRIQKKLADGAHDYVWMNGQLLAERTPDGTWTSMRRCAFTPIYLWR